MSKETCASELLEYLKQNEGWHKKVHLYAIAEDYSPETIGRDLRDLAKIGTINVDYYKSKKGKDLAMYSMGKIEPKKKVEFEIVEIDGKRIARIK